MNFKKLLASFIAVAALALPGTAQEAKASRPRVAVMEFPVAKGAWHGWAGWGVDHQAQMSDVIQDLMVTSLLENGRGKIRVIERAQLEAIRKEQALGQSGEVDPSTAVKLGKLLGVKYMLTGKITRFAASKKGFSSGWGAGAAVSMITGNPLAGAVAGSVNVKKTKFSGRLDVRIIDVETGEIVDAMSEEGQESDVSVKVAGTGNEVMFDQELINKVFEPVIKALAPKIVTSCATN